MQSIHLSHYSCIWSSFYVNMLHTSILSYPETSVPEPVKKKYYNLIMKFHEFMPDSIFRSEYIKLLTEIPVLPYMDNQHALLSWLYQIDSKLRIKCSFDEKTYDEFILDYRDLYKPRETIREEIHIKKKIRKNVFLVIIIVLLFIMTWRWNKRWSQDLFE